VARTMPGFAVGLGASVGWLYASGPIRIRVLGTGTYFPHGSAYPSTVEGADFDLATVGGRVCAAIAAGRFDVGPCIGSEYEIMRALAIKTPGAHAFPEASAEWWSLVGSGVVRWNPSRWLALAFRADALVSPSGPHFDTSPSTSQLVHQPSLLAIRSALGVEMYFF